MVLHMQMQLSTLARYNKGLYQGLPLMYIRICIGLSIYLDMYINLDLDMHIDLGLDVNISLIPDTCA